MEASKGPAPSWGPACCARRPPLRGCPFGWRQVPVAGASWCTPGGRTGQNQRCTRSPAAEAAPARRGHSTHLPLSVSAHRTAEAQVPPDTRCRQRHGCPVPQGAGDRASQAERMPEGRVVMGSSSPECSGAPRRHEAPSWQPPGGPAAVGQLRWHGRPGAGALRAGAHALAPSPPSGTTPGSCTSHRPRRVGFVGSLVAEGRCGG